jgi:hypothetical protein
VVEVGLNEEKVTIRIPGGQYPRTQHPREQAQAQRPIKGIDGDNIVVPNPLAGDRNDAAPKYVGQIPKYPARATGSDLVRNAGREGRCSL